MLSRMSVTTKWLQCRDERTDWDRVYSVEGPRYSSLTGEWDVFDCNAIVYNGPQIKGDKEVINHTVVSLAACRQAIDEAAKKLGIMKQ